MMQHAMLNNSDHQNLRVITDYSAALGDNIMCTLALPSEFRDLQVDYPIFFHKNLETGDFLPMVMFGLEQGENLFLGEQGWNAQVIPLMMRRGPFLIGFQQVNDNGIIRKNPVISLDMESPRLSTTEGEPIFLAQGGNTVYTEAMVSVLQAIDHGQESIKELVAALKAQSLLEPFSLDVTLTNGKQLRQSGFYTINEEKLASLNPDVLVDFSRRGILLAIFMVLASLSNIQRLIDLKNSRI